MDSRSRCSTRTTASRFATRRVKPLIILGYEGEPNLLFRDASVYRNARSTATYLNSDRYGALEAPPDTDPRAPPLWNQVAASEEFEWHDHRIHWMSRVSPPAVRADPDVAHHLFDWEVPGTLDGHPLVITGTLDYRPPSDNGVPKLLFVPLLVSAAGGFVLVRRWRAD
jgi:hypothetical protein